MDIIKQTEKKMNDALEHLKVELRNLRSNRANPGMLDSVQIEVYGSQMKIRDLGTVAAGDARSLVVTVFDPQTSGPVAKAIEKQLGFQPIVEGATVRIPIPPMSEEVRTQIAKQARQEGEKAKVVVRNVRREGNDLLKKQKGASEITEDIQKRSEKKIQELTDDFCKQIDTLSKDKEKEIMTV